MPASRKVRSCTLQTTKRYTDRQSPPYPANECAGQQKVGNNGEMYESRPDKNGVYRWYKAKSASAKKTVKRATKKVASTASKRKPAKTRERATPIRKTRQVSATRKAPADPAKLHKGRQLVGIDGNVYESRADRNSVWRWYKLSSAATGSQKRSTVKKVSFSKPAKKASLPKKATSVAKTSVKRQPKTGGCVAQTGTKYLGRPSPAYPANQCCGETKVGNDGNMYVSVANRSGVCRWVKQKQNKVAKKTTKVDQEPIDVDVFYEQVEDSDGFVKLSKLQKMKPEESIDVLASYHQGFFQDYPEQMAVKATDFFAKHKEKITKLNEKQFRFQSYLSDLDIVLELENEIDADDDGNFLLGDDLVIPWTTVEKTGPIYWK